MTPVCPLLRLIASATPCKSVAKVLASPDPPTLTVTPLTVKLPPVATLVTSVPATVVALTEAVTPERSETLLIDAAIAIELKF